MKNRQIKHRIRSATKTTKQRAYSALIAANQNPQVAKLLDLINRHKLVVAVGGSVVLAIIVTILNVAAYQASTVSDLDLSRPGFGRIRDQVRSDGNSTKTFSPNGPIDDAAISEFTGLYDTESSKLTNSSGFRGQVLSDEELRLSEQSEPVDPVE